MSEIKGLAELQKQLTKIKNIDKTKAVEKVGYYLMGESQRYITENLKHPEESTGFLANSPEVRNNGLGVFLVYTAHYAGYVELGTQFMEAMGFVGNTIEGHTDDMLKIAKEEVENQIKRSI